MFDDEGNRLGRVQEAGQHHTYAGTVLGPVVLFDVDGIVFPVRVSTPAMHGNHSSNTIYYVGTVCGGDPIIESVLFEPLMGMGVRSALPNTAVDGRTVYIEDQTYDVEYPDVGSYRKLPPAGDGSCRTDLTHTVRGVPALKFSDLLPEFTPPFRIEKEACASTPVAAGGPPYLIGLSVLIAMSGLWLIRHRRQHRDA
ncbi:MAG: hypothetical protein JRS35_16575 [Deltaproteobacteria bacterium]|nr:hypothetical protein [Deltaproteobacteria bacterium]